ncbi:hypothetical protein Tco_0947453 [Tanacetum coccineum]
MSSSSDKCTYSTGALKQLSLKSLGQLCFLTDHSSWLMEMEEEVAIKMIQKFKKLLKFQMDLQVPNQLGAGQSDHGPLTSPELRTASCDLHELCKSWFPTYGGEESLSCQFLANL